MPRYICTLPNTTAGKRVVDDLREYGGDGEITYLHSLGEYLRRAPGGEGSGLASAELVDTILPFTFHEIEIPEGQESRLVPQLLSRHNDPRGIRQRRGFIEAIELNRTVYLLGGPGQLFTIGGQHPSYMSQLNVQLARTHTANGLEARVAVVDTGSENLSFVTDFYDVSRYATNPHPGTAGQTDVTGHGTAMATLIHEIAPDAEIHVIRICEDVPSYFQILAGVTVAVFDCHAHIVNISLGFKNWGGWCNICFTTAAARSIALGKLLEGLLDLDPLTVPGYVAPIYVSGTGNDGSSSGFYYPAAYESVVAVGSVDSRNQLSSFSTRGTSHPLHLLAPGGQWDASGNVTEHVGSGPNSEYHGTSVATAYVSGMLALLYSDYRRWTRHGGTWWCRCTPTRDDLIHAALSLCTLPSGTHSVDYGNGVIEYR